MTMLATSKSLARCAPPPNAVSNTCTMFMLVNSLYLAFSCWGWYHESDFVLVTSAFNRLLEGQQVEVNPIHGPLKIPELPLSALHL